MSEAPRDEKKNNFTGASTLRRSRNRSRSAVAALVWAALTTPLTTVPLLYWAGTNQRLARMAESLPRAGAAALAGLILIGLPATAILIASASLSRINSSWTPIGGGHFARYALVISIFSILTAAAILVIALT